MPALGFQRQKSGFIKEYQYVEDNKKQGGKTNGTE